MTIFERRQQLAEHYEQIQRGTVMMWQGLMMRWNSVADRLKIPPVDETPSISLDPNEFKNRCPQAYQTFLSFIENYNGKE